MKKKLTDHTSTMFTLKTASQYNYAPSPILTKRIIAYIIDAFILGILGVVLFFINLATFGILSGIFTFIIFLLPISYHSYMISSSNQATLGQKALNLKQINLNGSSISGVQAVIQTILFYMTLSFTGGILLIWSLFDDKGRCLHEILSNTAVVNDQE